MQRLPALALLIIAPTSWYVLVRGQSRQASRGIAGDTRRARNSTGWVTTRPVVVAENQSAQASQTTRRCLRISLRWSALAADRAGVRTAVQVEQTYDIAPTPGRSLVSACTRGSAPAVGGTGELVLAISADIGAADIGAGAGPRSSHGSARHVMLFLDNPI